jgi:DNA gyrase/topoisomerase IV subunit B
MDAGIPPMRRGGPCVLDRLLDVMGGLHGYVRRLVNNRMVSLCVMARRKQETAFQAFNRGLKLDRTTGPCTIGDNRIHDRYAPPGQMSNADSDSYTFLEFRHQDHCQETFEIQASTGRLDSLRKTHNSLYLS